MRPGNVPTSVVGPVIATLIEDRWPARLRPDAEEYGTTILAEKVGCHIDSIDAIVRQVNPGAEFDLVDKILCALGRPDMWIGQLADIYPTKFVETCALHSCNKKFPERFGGRTRKRYCSPRCSTLGNAVARGEATGARLRQKGYCLKGHKMTPENTITKWRERDQKFEQQCRECKRATQREWMRKKRADPEFRQRAVERTRRWRKGEAVAA